MSDEIKSVSDIAKEVAVPFYNDAVSPAAKEFGKGLTSLSRMVNSGVFLAEECVTALVSVLHLTGEQLCILPPEQVCLNKPRVSASVLEEARFAINEPEIQGLFANLLTASMDKERSKYAHPAYVETIRQLDSDEAKILQYMASLGGKAPSITIKKTSSVDFKKDGTGIKTTEIYDGVNLICEEAGCVHLENEITYIENLKRLGLVTSSKGTSFVKSGKGLYRRIFESEKAEKLKLANPHLNNCSFSSNMYIFTPFGRAFMKACLNDNKST